MNREELSKLPIGTFKCLFAGKPALLVKECNSYTYLKHNKFAYRGSGVVKEPFKYSWCVYSPNSKYVHEPLNLSKIVFNPSNISLGEL